MEHPGFIKAKGNRIYDGFDQEILFRGVNLGNWFLPENYMNVESVGSFQTGIYTQQRGIDALKNNPNINEEQQKELYDIYMSTYIQEEDFKTIAFLGLNLVRIVFSYRNISPGGLSFPEEGFRYLDWTLAMCEKYHLYAILDLHGAYGSQNQDFHSGDDTKLDLFINQDDQEKTIRLWQTLASRYKDRKIIAGYDLLNEPRKAYKKFANRMVFDFYDKLYHAIREIDSNHMIFIEAFTFPIHGTRIQKYHWENVCMEYHIYNLTFLSQMTVLCFYSFLDKFMGYRLPIYIGEFNAFDNPIDWIKTLDYFDKKHWSCSSWTYKTNARMYNSNRHMKKNWGILELDMKPVDLSSSNYEEIKNTYLATHSKNAKKSFIYQIYQDRYGKNKVVNGS